MYRLLFLTKYRFMMASSRKAVRKKPVIRANSMLSRMPHFMTNRRNRENRKAHSIPMEKNRDIFV